MIAKLCSESEFDSPEMKLKYPYVRKVGDFVPRNYSIERSGLIMECYVHKFLFFFRTDFQFERYNIINNGKCKLNDQEWKSIEEFCKNDTEKNAFIRLKAKNLEASGMPTLSVLTALKCCSGLLFVAFSFYATAAILGPVIRPSVIISATTVQDNIIKFSSTLVDSLTKLSSKLADSLTFDKSIRSM